MLPVAERARSTWRARQEIVSLPARPGLFSSACVPVCQRNFCPRRIHVLRRERGKRNGAE